MTNLSEDVILSSLSDIEALEVLAKSGFNTVCVPTEEIRPIIDWAIGVYFDSGRRQAPSREMMEHRWGDVLELQEVELSDPAIEIDPIEEAISDLRSQHVQVNWQDWIKSAATDMSTAVTTEKVEALSVVANDLFTLVSQVQDRSSESTAAEGFKDALADYKERKASGHRTRGMTFGLDLIDDHTYGIHGGELGVLAAGPKVGKSYFLLRVALHEWAVNGHNVALFSLENTVDMSMDRLVCIQLGINPREWQRGQCSNEDEARVEAFIADELPALRESLHILSPGRGDRTPERLCREARLRGCSSVLVDQMSHVEHPNPGRKPRHELFNENIHEFADLIKDGHDPISMLIAHQINRAGVEAGRKLNYHEMEHLAESAGMERAADWVFALHQNLDERIQEAAKFQIMAARREDTKNWQIAWSPMKYEAMHKIDLERAA